jgi:hypothetical protein
MAVMARSLIFKIRGDEISKQHPFGQFYLEEREMHEYRHCVDPIRL